jgi:hypothetical protein
MLIETGVGKLAMVGERGCRGCRYEASPLISRKRSVSVS